MSRLYERLPSWTNSNGVELHAILTRGSREDVNYPGGVINVFTAKPDLVDWRPHNAMDRIGFISWVDETVEFLQVWTEKRGNGIASKMLEYARTICPELVHSDDLSEDGAKFAERTE